MMKNILIMCFCFSLSACGEQDLKKENEELLDLTKNLTTTVEGLKLQVEKQQELALMAAAEAKAAQAEAERQVIDSERKPGGGESSKT